MSLLTCSQFIEELSEYLDESVREGLREELEAHMAQCPNCWVMVDTTKKTLQFYKDLEPEPIPSSLHSRLMSALQAKMATRGKS